MEQRFVEEWYNYGIETEAEPYFRVLESMYTQKERYYHNLTHIKKMFEYFDEFPEEKYKHEAIPLAIFYHDYVYDSKSNHNEKSSAEYVESVIKVHGRKNSEIPIYNFIMATKGHEANNMYEELLIDLDFSILGAKDAEFDEYERNIKKEYSWVPQELYVKERKKFLTSILNRDSIFLTDYFKEKLEEKAKENIKRSLLLF